MRNILLSIAFLFVFSSCARTGLKKYYTRISPEEFASYDSAVFKVKSKYGNVYRAYQHVRGNFKIDFLVYQKIENGEKGGLYKLDSFTEIKNDSTFIFYGDPLQTNSDSNNWPKGLWFHTHTEGSTTDFQTDSVPPNKPNVNYSAFSMGIYNLQKGKLVKISAIQSEEEFNRLHPEGFVYLPNPGRFYLLAKFTQVK